MVFSGSAVVVEALSVFLFAKKVKMKELPKYSFNFAFDKRYASVGISGRF